MYSPAEVAWKRRWATERVGRATRGVSGVRAATRTARDASRLELATARGSCVRSMGGLGVVKFLDSRWANPGGGREIGNPLVGGGYTISVTWCRGHIHQQHVLPCPPSTYSRTLVASSRVSPAPTIKHATSEFKRRGPEPCDGRQMLPSGIRVREDEMATQRASAGALPPRAHRVPGKANAHTHVLAWNPCGTGGKE